MDTKDAKTAKGLDAVRMNICGLCAHGVKAG